MPSKTTGILEKIRRGEVNPFKGMFTTTAEAKENEKFNNLQKAINIASVGSKGLKSNKGKGLTPSQIKNLGQETSFSLVTGTKAPKSNNTSEKSTVTNAKIVPIGKSGSSNKKENKQSITKMQNKINATDQANFEAARKKLRGVGSSMDEMSKAAADTNIELVSKSKDINPETNVSNTKKERRQLLRARRRAGRKSTDGTYTADQLRAERDKIKSRSAARKDYLRNFASYLARGEQAAPRTGFGQGGDNPNNDTSLAGNSGTKKEVSDNNEMAKSDYRDIFSTMSNIGNDNSSLTNYDRGMSGLLKLDEDSTPNNYMQKEYRKKRGY